MPKSVHYINRHRLPQYNSIEELFLSIQQEVTKTRHCFWTELAYYGGSPKVILNNLIGVKPRKNVIYHITGDVHYMALRLGKSAILTVHDVRSVIDKGPYFRRLYLKLFWFWWPALAVKKITVISEFSKQELIKVVPFAKTKIRVIPNPVSAQFKPSPLVFNTSNPHILFVGTKDNKNLIRCFEALSAITCKAIIVGELNATQLDVLKANNIDYTNKINLTKTEMVRTYEECHLLCYPSTYEGFGMPIIEAQAVGRPVVTSHLGAMKEVAGDAACLVDPFSVTSIREGLLKVINHQDYRRYLVEKGFQNIQRFDLTAIVKRYEALYEEVLP